ncbi:MAG TPA: cache domain-containing protein [Nitrososphaeraceae archaeon]|nr:cache domain-containing protein [Nitrososphaeraceae archaeon]
MRRILYIQIFFSFIILLIGTISFLKFQDDRIIFERIIAQEDISIKNNNSLLLQDNQTEVSIHNKNTIVQLLANHLETKLNKSAIILKIVSDIPQSRALPNASLINPSFHGIPKDAEIQKRQIFQNILSIDKDFEVISYLMPNGDMYFQEPYSRQENLTRDNFALRDYYKGAVSTGDTYLGNVIISASSGLPVVLMSIPLYSSANDSSSSKANHTENLIGLLGANQGISTFNKFLQSLPISKNETAIYIDNNGQIIASSSSSPLSPINKQGQSNAGGNISSLQSFKDVISGKSGYNIENINNKDMLIVYAPVKFKSTIWGVLFFSPLSNNNNNKSIT